MAYDVSEHPRLSTKAQQLFARDPDLFADEQALAIERLGLASDTSYTAVQLVSINRAIAFQINWQLEVPIGTRYIKQESSSKSQQSITYRDGISLLSQDALDALPIEVYAGAWGDITSLRRAVQ